LVYTKKNLEHTLSLGTKCDFLDNYNLTIFFTIYFSLEINFKKHHILV